MLRQILAASLLLFACDASAEEISNRFCVQRVETTFDLNEDQRFTVHAVVQTGNPEHDIFFLGRRPNSKPAKLIGEKFIVADIEFPTWRDVDNILISPDGEVVGLGGWIGERIFFRQDAQSGEFNRLKVGGSDDLINVREISWSTPLRAILATTEHATYVLRNDEATRIEELSEWVTKIVDFPELNLTFLATEFDDRIYLIDAKQKIHDVGSLNLGEWIFVKEVVFLDNPPRLLIDAKEAMGPFRGRYLVHLERLDGTWKPNGKQDFKNVLADYDRLGEKGLEKVQDSQVRTLRMLPRRKVETKSDNPFLEDTFTTIINMPKSGARAVLRENGFVVIDDSGLVHKLKVDGLVAWRFGSSRHAKYLENRGEVFTAESNGYYLIKDKNLSGSDACA